MAVVIVQSPSHFSFFVPISFPSQHTKRSISGKEGKRKQHFPFKGAPSIADTITITTFIPDSQKRRTRPGSMAFILHYVFVKGTREGILSDDQATALIAVDLALALMN